MERLSHSEVLERYGFDPESACVPREGVRNYGGETEPLYPYAYVLLFHRCIENGAIRA